MVGVRGEEAVVVLVKGLVVVLAKAGAVDLFQHGFDKLKTREHTVLTLCDRESDSCDNGERPEHGVRDTRRHKVYGRQSRSPLQIIRAKQVGIILQHRRREEVGQDQ